MLKTTLKLICFAFLIEPVKMFHSIKHDNPDIAKQVATISKKLTSQICSTFCIVKDVH